LRTYRKATFGKHRGADSVMDDLRFAAKFRANLLWDTAPLPDGSIDKQDARTLREIGRRIRANGWPKAA